MAKKSFLKQFKEDWLRGAKIIGGEMTGLRRKSLPERNVAAEKKRVEELKKNKKKKKKKSMLKRLMAGDTSR